VQIVAPEHEAKLRANVAMHQRLGIPSLLVTADDVRRLAPAFAVDDFSFAAYEPESGYADPTGTASAFLSAARVAGARLIQDVRVTAVDTQAGRVRGVTTSQGSFEAPIVVNAAGPWAKEVGLLAGLDLPITTWRHDTAFLRRPKDLGPSHPTAIDFINLMYFRPETGGLTLVGLEDSNPLGVSPETGGEQPQPDFVERAVDRICRRIPGMERGSLQSAQAGYDGLTPDQRAILDQAGPEGFYLICGFSGTGFKIAPAVGACMAEWIADGRPQTVDISAFTWKRFEQGRHLAGEHAYGEIWR
jgi:sarcosine oxidase subunit beta